MVCDASVVLCHSRCNSWSLSIKRWTPYSKNIIVRASLALYAKYGKCALSLIGMPKCFANWHVQWNYGWTLNFCISQRILRVIFPVPSNVTFILNLQSRQLCPSSSMIWRSENGSSIVQSTSTWHSPRWTQNQSPWWRQQIKTSALGALYGFVFDDIIGSRLN